jgi:lipooligosaccharide transport system permease protein
LGGVPGDVHPQVAAVTPTPGISAGRPPALLRILPLELFAARRPQRMFERGVMFYRRKWVLFVSGFFEPLLYLLSVQVGFATLVGTVTDGGITYDYAEFVAPALLASAAMNGAIFDATGGVFEKLKHTKLYDTVLATPMTSADVALGEIMTAVARGSLYSVAFVVAMVALGLVGSPLILLAIPVCAVIAFAFGAIGMAYATYMRAWADLEYVNVAIVPMLLFSATFYPLSSYGAWSWVVQLSPLYHGVVIVRGCAVGVLEWSMLVNLGVLLAIAVAGVTLISRRVDHLLLR